MGFEAARTAQHALGDGARALLRKHGYRVLAAEGFGAPGVVVCHTDRPELQNGSAFVAAGFQIAAGVPLMVGEGAGFRTFRIGLFGLDKLRDVPGTLARLEAALVAVA
jgi:aspartate aminotransferase-like enzyme